MTMDEGPQGSRLGHGWWVDDDAYQADDANQSAFGDDQRDLGQLAEADRGGDGIGHGDVSGGGPSSAEPDDIENELGEDDDDDDDEFERLTYPRSIRLDSEVRRSVFLSLHGAYHALAQRVEQSTRDLGLSASETVVILAARATSGSTVAWLRRETGLHPSTMSTLLKRLEGRGLIERQTSWDPRFVLVRLTSRGETAADMTHDLLTEIDDEIAVFVPARQRAGPEAILAATVALSRPGRPADF